jgi:hypothetical protein
LNRPIAYRKLLAHLHREYGVWEDVNRGKGSERMWFRIAGGTKCWVPVTCHGEGGELKRGLVGTIRRRLFPGGIDDNDFYP